MTADPLEYWLGAERIWAERRRQIEDEGWGAQHDDNHGRGELVLAAISYLLCDFGRWHDVNPRSAQRIEDIGDELWPWDPSWWKPASRIRNLEKAGALIAAEIDRLVRLRRAEGKCDAD